MGKRYSDTKNKNHQKRKQKQANKQNAFIEQQNIKKATALLLKRETALALSTVPQPGTSRQQKNDINTPSIYFHHVIRKTVQEEVDKIFNPSEKQQDPEELNASVTPCASQDFFD